MKIESSMPNADFDTGLIEKLQAFGRQNEYQKYLDALNEALRRVETRENNEPMLDLTEHLTPDIYFDLSDLRVSVEHDQRLFLWKGVVERLNQAQER